MWSGATLGDHDVNEESIMICEDHKSFSVRLSLAETLLEDICMGLEENKVPMSPDLLDWWIRHNERK